MPCLDENTLLAFLDGSLSAAERAATEAHFDECDDCRRLAAALVTQSTELPSAQRSGSTPRGGAELQPGDRVDQYVLLRLVGRGGMGRVWLARDTTLGRKVALKLLPDLARSTGDEVDRFLREARLTARFNHPHIVTLYGVGQVQDTPYLALEFVEGETLRARLDAEQLGLQVGLRIGLAVAKAVLEAHRHDVLHRDLKPQNVLLAVDGRVRVLDFGLAKPTGAAPDNAADPDAGGAEPITVTDPRVRFGTPAYMAPEQWRAEPSTPATDVWGLGGILYEVLTGQRPYGIAAKDRRQRSREIRAVVCSSDPLPSVADANPELPEDLVALVDGCLRKDPGDRPHLGAVIEGLQDALQRHGQVGDLDALPFRGLLPLTERHAAVFYGRDVELGRFLERLRTEPILPVVGPTGAGKSSFVRAGVIPRLREHGRWLVLRMRPGKHPFETLAARLELGESASSRLGDSGEHDAPDTKTNDTTPADRDEPLEQWLAQHPTRLTLELGRLAEAQQSRVLLFVDQLEELYTLVEDDAQRRAFMRGLCAAADDPEGPVRVVFTLRDDFLWRLAEGPEAQAALGRIVVLRPPGPEALTEFLERTVAAAGYRFDPRSLPEEMVREVAGEAAALPLLQFAGQQIWQRRDRERRVLTRDAFEAVGGVAGALAQHADETLAALPPQHERLARTIFLRLVTPELTRRVVSRADLLADLEEGAEEVLDRLTEARAVLVRRSLRGPAELELVHESLIHTWAPLKLWLEESREERAFLAEVEQAATLWDQRGRDDAEVWQGEALAKALRQAARCQALPQLSERFLEAGREREARGARRRRFTRVTAVALLALVALSALLFSLTLRQKEHEAQRQRREAQRQRAEAERHQREAQRQQRVALLESAQAALSRGGLVEARAKLRQVLEAQDSPLARALWSRVQRSDLRWRKRLGAILYDVSFAPDGRTVAVASLDHAVHLFDVVTGQRRVLRGHTDQVMAAAYSPDGRHLVSTTWRGDIWIWDLRSGKSRPLGSHPKGINALAFDARGTRLATASSDRTVRVWAVPAGRLLATLRGHSGAVRDVAFAPDGRQLTTTALDGTVRVWTVDGRELRQLPRARDTTLALAYHPQGTQLATAGEDRAVRLWDARTGASLGARQGHTARVLGLAYSPDGKLLASAGADKTVRLWSATSGRLVRVLRGHESPVRGVAFSPDGRHMCSVSEDGHTLLWSVARAATPHPLGGHAGAIMGLSFHPGGGWVASGGVDRTVRLWDTVSGQVVRVLRGHQAQVLGVAFSPDGKRLASGSNDRSVIVWEARTGRTLAVLRGHEGPTFDVSFSPDGKTLASSSYDRTVRLWDLTARPPRVQRVLRGHDAKIYDARFSPDGKTLVTTGADRTARIWDVASGRERAVLRDHQNTVRGASFSPDGKVLATGGIDRTVRLWDLTARPPRLQRRLGPHPGRVYGAQFTPDGKGLGAPCSDGTVRLWDLASGRARVLRAHRSEVNILRFSADGRRVATASDDGTVRLWDTRSGRPVWRAPALLPSRHALLTHHGWQVLGAAGAALPTAKWRTAVQAAVRAAESANGRRICVLDPTGALALWDVTRDRRLQHHRERPDAQVVALRGGCATLARGRAALLDVRGRYQVLRQGATALAAVDGELLLAAGQRVYRYTDRGALKGSFAASTGVTAITRVARWWVLGYGNGGIELRDRRATRTPPRLSVDNTPASPVVRLLPGPRHWVVAGFADGHYGLWSVPEGTELARGRVHGPAVHLLQRAGDLFVASDLGRLQQLRLRALHLGYCPLLRRVWRAAPVVWQEGRPRRRAAPAGHRCAR